MQPLRLVPVVVGVLSHVAIFNFANELAKLRNIDWEVSEPP